MNYNIIARDSFQRAAKHLAKRHKSFKQDFLKLIEQLEEKPDSGIDLGNGFRKIRMEISSKRKGVGKVAPLDYYQPQRGVLLRA